MIDDRGRITPTLYRRRGQYVYFSYNLVPKPQRKYINLTAETSTILKSLQEGEITLHLCSKEKYIK